MTLFNKNNTHSKLFNKSIPENSIFKKLHTGVKLANAGLKIGQFILPHYHNLAQKHINNNHHRNYNDLEKNIR
jgi:hypothetical protein